MQNNTLNSFPLVLSSSQLSIRFRVRRKKSISVLNFSFLFACLFNILQLSTSDDAQEICQSRFARYSRSHTACVPPSQTCKILSRGLEVNAQQLILDVHNHYRAYIAAGNESRLGFPGAANMLKLEWDNELAYVAQAHADQCKFEHDCYDCRRTGKFKVVGQNLYVYQTSRPATQTRQDWRSIIKEWYDEIKIAPPSVARSFNLHELNIGHFTQMAWASTNRVGCGAVTYELNEPDTPFKTAVLYTCNYAPGGNFLGEKMYRKGPAASQCPKRYKPSPNWPTLCEYGVTTTRFTTSSHVNVSTSQVTSSSVSNNGSTRVTNIVRKKIVTTRKKTKKITKKINGASVGTITTTTTTTNTNSNIPNAGRPKILVTISTPKPSILNWTTSQPVTVVHPPIIVPTAKPVPVTPPPVNVVIDESPIPTVTYGPSTNQPEASSPQNQAGQLIPEFVPTLIELQPQQTSPPTPPYSQPSSPSYSQPSTPSYSQPPTPPYSFNPSTPSYISSISTPSYSEPSTPSSNHPYTPSPPSTPSYTSPPQDGSIPSYISSPPTTPRPKIVIEDNHIAEIIPTNIQLTYSTTRSPPIRQAYPTTRAPPQNTYTTTRAPIGVSVQHVPSTTRAPVTIRPLNSGGTHLVAAVAPWWRKWIVNTTPLTSTPSTRRPTRSRIVPIVSSINRNPFTISTNKWPGSVTNINTINSSNNNYNRKPAFSNYWNKPNSQSSTWGTLFTSSSNEAPRVANAHWSSQNRYFLTHNLTNNASLRPQSVSAFSNSNLLDNGQNYRFSRFSIGRT